MHSSMLEEVAHNGQPVVCKKPQQLHAVIVEVAKAVCSNHTVPLYGVYCDTRIKMAHVYEVSSRHFGERTVQFLKEGIIFSLQTGRIQLYQGQRFTLLYLQLEDYYPSADRLPINGSICEVGSNNGLTARRDMDT
ncbi:unnamed protein product [Soboliphyme baturini]|uniref:Mediator of RNA polymerase II transcription subunit 20 n=1 Tax=Soboliphyme baturini TaxID=241478 RepID=A0A183J5X2_9BILA|nr:unnamed protein product [Soboliphyme baturini]